MKPSKPNFPGFVNLSPSVPDKLVNIQINDAYKFDIKPRLGSLAIDIYNYEANDKPELREFYDDYILHWWVLLAYKRLVQVHGLNFTQFGITKTRDPQNTFDQASAQEKAVLLKQLQHDIDVLFANLSGVKWVFDNTTYKNPNTNCGSTEYNSSGINAIE
jgi:hypothetical protein